jgi:hypothetical protein
MESMGRNIHIILGWGTFKPLHVQTECVLQEAQSCKIVVQISHAQTDMNVWTYLYTN